MYNELLVGFYKVSLLKISSKKTSLLKLLWDGLTATTAIRAYTHLRHSRNNERKRRCRSSLYAKIGLVDVVFCLHVFKIYILPLIWDRNWHLFFSDGCQWFIEPVSRHFFINQDS